MATPTVLDVERLLAPIPGDNPSGKNLAYEAAYDQLKEARRSEDASLQGDWKRKIKTADWDRVIDLGSSLLASETKDLQIAAWMTEGLARRYGFAGLREGFRLLRELQETFWETCYPEIDDGDLETRGAPYLFIDRTLPLVVRSIKLTSGFGDDQYSYLGWQESRATDNVGLKNPELMESLIAEGKITTKQFDDAVAQSPRRFYETLVNDLQQCAEALKALDNSLDDRFGRDAPGLTGVRKAVDECNVLLIPILETKREQEPDPEDDRNPAEEESASGEPDPYQAERDSEPAPRPARRAPTGARTASGPIADVADAFDRIQGAAAYLREHDPASPVPYLVVRAVRMAEVYGQSDPLDSAHCEGPSSTVRVALKRLASEGEWGQVLEQAEQAMGRPEGRAWLDLHRYALAAMTSGDIDRSAAANACRSFLRAFLADFPGLVDAELNDGTPTASSETRTWLRDEILPQASAEPVAPEPVYYIPPPREEDSRPHDGTSANSEPDVWASALELARAKRTPEAIDLIRRAMSTATTGRERFLRKLELAELCLMDNRHNVALLFCEDLARQIDEYKLEAWESEPLCARVWAAYYRCLRGVGSSNAAGERLQQVFGRLCRLDVNQASSLASDLLN